MAEIVAENRFETTLTPSEGVSFNQRDGRLYHCNGVTMMDLEDACARLFAYLRSQSSGEFPNNISEPYWVQRYYDRGTNQELLWLLVSVETEDKTEKYLFCRAYSVDRVSIEPKRAYQVELYYENQAAKLITEIMTDFEYACYSYHDQYCTRTLI